MKDSVPGESLDCSIGRIIHMLSHQMTRQDIMGIEDIGLTPMQNHVMRFILFASSSRDIYQRDVETEFSVRRPTATGILKLLEKNGYITRVSVPEDARLKKIVPTKKGEDLRAQIIENISRMNRKLIRGIPEEELSVCRDVLENMLRNLRGDGGESK